MKESTAAYFLRCATYAHDQGLEQVIDRLDTETIENYLGHDGGFLMVAFADAGHDLRIGITANHPGYLLCLYKGCSWDALDGTEVTTLDQVITLIRNTQAADGQDGAVAAFLHGAG